MPRQALMSTDLPLSNRRQGKVRDIYETTLPAQARSGGTGTPVLRETVALLATGGRRRLRYAVYWAAPVNDSAGLRRLACRLLGFEG